MTVSRFQVRAMDCTAEEQLVRMRLAEVDGIDGVGVDLDAREVTVQHRIETSDIDTALQSLDLGTTHLGDDGVLDASPEASRERSALRVALVINAVFFVGELTAGLVSRSMGLVADALDMGADAAVYALSLLAVGSTRIRKNRLARTSGYLQFGLAAIGLIEVVRRFVGDDAPPEVATMIVVSLLALAGNVATLVVLRRVKSGEAHFQASWIFTANDIKVNTLVVAAAIAVAITDTPYPDLIAGAIIFLIVANGARRIIRLAAR